MAFPLSQQVYMYIHGRMEGEREGGRKGWRERGREGGRDGGREGGREGEVTFCVVRYVTCLLYMPMAA